MNLSVENSPNLYNSDSTMRSPVPTTTSTPNEIMTDPSRTLTQPNSTVDATNVLRKIPSRHNRQHANNNNSAHIPLSGHTSAPMAVPTLPKGSRWNTIVAKSKETNQLESQQDSKHNVVDEQQDSSIQDSNNHNENEATRAAVHLLVPKGSAKFRNNNFSSSSSSESSSLGSSSADLSPNDAINTAENGQMYNTDQSTQDATSHELEQKKQTRPHEGPLTQQNSHIEGDYKILPSNFKDCSRDDLILLISRMLTHIISLNDEIDVKISSQQLTRFHSRAPPNISVYHYLSRLAQYSSLENAVLITAVYYIDLLSSTYPVFSVNSLTVHRFLLTATTVGSKGLCDSFCSNNHYAKVGGVHISELNVLEAEFLANVNWRVVPRDFTQQQHDSIARRDSSSTGTLNDDVFAKSAKRGVASAEEILDLYYRRMLTLFGEDNEIDTMDIPNHDLKFKLAPVENDFNTILEQDRSLNIAQESSISEIPNMNLKRTADHVAEDFTAIRGKRR